ncbi:MAG: histidine--tRNA ligase [Acidobacteria bacterium]|nr:histidine--tRNA ligase [Acidobacteriota bacterium]
MARKEPIRAVKGMRDILPPESALWEHIEDVAREIFRTYAYQEIRTPLVEPTDLFARGVGADTDIVTKEMYTWEDRDKSSLTLRPEATASVIRAYIEHRLDLRPGVKKFYYMGPMFRRERPQKGRYRQFYQIGAEAIGSESPAVDAEVIEMLVSLLDRLRVCGYTLLLNSVGDKECRPRYIARLREELKKVRSQLCEDCQRRSETNPLRVLDCKVPEDQPIIAKLPTIADSLCEACRTHFEKLQGYLRERNIPYTLQPRMVRGLDYYTRTAFEFVHGSLGAQNSLLGGGRYDGLSEDLGGPPAPGIGFSIGEDRLVLTMQETKNDLSEVAWFLAHTPPVYIAWMGEAAYARAASVAREFRGQGHSIEVAADDTKLKKSLENASKLGMKYVLIIGERELEASRYPLRNMTTGEQWTVTAEELAYLYGHRTMKFVKGTATAQDMKGKAE